MRTTDFNGIQRIPRQTYSRGICLLPRISGTGNRRMETGPVFGTGDLPAKRLSQCSREHANHPLPADLRTHSGRHPTVSIVKGILCLTYSRIITQAGALPEGIAGNAPAGRHICE